MFRVGHRPLIVIAGVIWFLIGLMLLTLGLHFIIDALYISPTHFSPLAKLAKLFGGDQTHGAIVLITASLLLGVFKGRMALAKSAKRQINRIIHLPTPTSIKNIYSPGMLLLIAAMMTLGMSMRFLPISLDMRGAIDVVVGSALLHGALVYFRFASTGYAAQNKNRSHIR